MTAFFITATGTDVGKTYVATGLIRHWRAAGRKVQALKPVASGFDLAAVETTDTDALLAALGRAFKPSEIDRVSPWRFLAPLSPDMAAERENLGIDFETLLQFSRDALAAADDIVLIEGIGGIMVPLTTRHTVLDWMAALSTPLVLVAGSYVGSLSHTLTCLDVLTRCGLTVKALVVNETPGSPVTPQDTIKTLRNFAPDIPMVALPWRPEPQPDDGAFRAIAQALEA